MVLLGEVFPDFEAESTEGTINFHKWIGNSWAIVFSHPADFTPVCTTELGEAAKLSAEFCKRGVKMLAISCDSVADHKAWITDIKAYNSLGSSTCTGSSGFPYPIVADTQRHLAVKLGMLDPDEKSAQGLPLTARAVFVVGPDTKLKLSILYPATTGRNFCEILRVIDSLQLTAQKKVATPVNWKEGDDCMVVPSLSDAEAKQLFPTGFKSHELPSGKNYIRTTPYPK